MEHGRLFVLQVVLVIEDQWFEYGYSSSAVPSQVRKDYQIEEMLFSAADVEAAYRAARSWIEGGAFTDANHDGDGDVTKYYALGIHELAETTCFSELSEELAGPYGVELPGFSISAVGAEGVPLVRSKDELEVFRLARI